MEIILTDPFKMKEILEKIENLPHNLKDVFNRIYDVRIYNDAMKVPEKLKERFSEAANQQIIIITNKILYQETAFNLLRAKRSEPTQEARGGKREAGNNECPFCEPKKFTPEDEIGRLENESAITGGNIADSLKYHSLLIFKKHNFSDLTKNEIEKGFELITQWWDKIFQYDAKLKYGFSIWNQGFRAAASVYHPHLQIFADEILPEKFALIEDKISDYRQKHNSNLYDDLFLLHKNLELAKEINGLKIIVSLTPFKDKEIILISNNDAGKNIKNLADTIYAYKNFTENFNLFLLKEPYCDLPVGFLIDRGESEKKNADIGGLELYAFSVVGFDLEKFAKELLSSIG